MGNSAIKPVGNGVLLWFQTDAFDAAMERARALHADILEQLKVNNHRECWLRISCDMRRLLGTPQRLEIAPWAPSWRMVRVSRLTWRTERFSHKAASDCPMVRSITCWITAYRSASFKLSCNTSAMTAPKHERGHLNLVKRGHCAVKRQGQGLLPYPYIGIVLQSHRALNKLETPCLTI